MTAIHVQDGQFVQQGDVLSATFFALSMGQLLVRAKRLAGSGTNLRTIAPTNFALAGNNN